MLKLRGDANLAEKTFRAEDRAKLRLQDLERDFSLVPKIAREGTPLPFRRCRSHALSSSDRRAHHEETRRLSRAGHQLLESRILPQGVKPWVNA